MQRKNTHVVMTANVAWAIWNFRRGLVESFLASGCRVTIVAERDESVEFLEALGCNFLPLAIDRKGISPLRNFSLLVRLMRVFKSESPDIVLSYTVKNNIFGCIAAKVLKIPIVPNITGLGTAFLSSRMLQFLVEGLYRVAFKSIPFVFFQNIDDASQFTSARIIQNSQAYILPGSGIDLERFKPIEYPTEDKVVSFLMVSRMLRDKGVTEFVEAARITRELYPEIKFKLLGPVDLDNRSSITEEEIRSWETEGIVEFLGATKDVQPYISAAHCVLLPSYREGAPRTLIEAAALARPIITTDVPGCRAVVENKYNGFLCRPRDPHHLANKIQEFLKLSNSEKKMMGIRGRQKIEREFNQEIVHEFYEMAVSEILGK